MSEYYLYTKRIRSRFKSESIPYITLKKTAACMVSALILSLTCTSTAHAASQTLKYTYDTLGRVTFVEDSSNGNRDYDFDKVGNRTLVAVGNDSDADADGGDGQRAPETPSGLYVNGPLSMYGGYICSWKAVTSATAYQIGLADGSTYAVSNKNSFDSPGPRPSWVRAYNINGYSPKAYF